MLRLRRHRSLRCAAAGALAYGVAALAGCAGTQGPLPASRADAPFHERAVAFLRVGHRSNGLSGIDADAVVALAIAEHEMRRP